MFQMILNGMENATALHGSSIQEFIVNDQLRNFFIKLLFEEIDLINKFIKYGKLKGWIQNIPMYKRA